MTSLQELHHNFVRPLNLTWSLDNRSRRRLILICALPAIVVLGEALNAVLTYSYDPIELVTDQVVGGPPELLRRLYRAAEAVESLAPVAIGILFLAGLRRWSPAEGSWMFAAGAVLAGTALIVGAALTFVLTASSNEGLLFDLRVQFVWKDIAETFGLLSVGFFFVAYRGLAADHAASAPPDQRFPEESLEPPN